MTAQDIKETFHISGSMKKKIVFGLIFFGGVLLLSIALPFIMPQLLKIIWLWVFVIIGYCCFAKLFFTAWKERNNYISVTNDGIALHSPESKIELIKWHEISAIKENNIFERLQLYSNNNKSIKIEYELSGLNKLLNILISNIPHLTAKYSLITTFRRTAHLHLFFTIALLFIVPFIVYGIYTKELLYSLAFTGFSAAIVWAMLVEFVRIEVGENSVTTVFPLWRKNIPFSQIHGLTIENIRNANGKAAQCVLLKLANGKTIRLNAVKEGTIALYSALQKKLKVS